MQSLSELKTRFLQRGQPTAVPARPAAGLYHFEREQEDEKSRVHLRVEADGRGLLTVNASRIYHLNPTAAYMAYLYLQQTPQDQVIRGLTRVYHVKAPQALQDYTTTVNQLEELIRPDGACPVCDLELEVSMPFSAQLSAPYGMDLAITYLCSNDCAHCYNARPRQGPELTTAQWKEILDRLWQAGIPHIVFTGGEPTLRPDLPELIAHAEHNGQITGINTNGRRLADPNFIQQLVEAGLDHAQITLESHDARIHDTMVTRSGAWRQTVAGIRNALASRLYVMTNTTLLQNNFAGLDHTLDFLAEIGVPTVGLNALIYSGHGLNVNSGLPESSLPPLLDLARAKTSQHSQKLIWYTPTQYCHFDPTQLQLGVKGCSAGLYNMCVEPDGSVIPCQSYYVSMGNMLELPWEKIWNHDLAVSLRTRRDTAAECTTCALLAECGGGCPLARLAGQNRAPQPISPFKLEGLED
jgi:radical SAM protein with 4Fe4S-binding SPASM domain